MAQRRKLPPIHPGELLRDELDGRRYKATTGKTSKQAARKVERNQRMRLQSGYNESVQREEREQRRRTIKVAANVRPHHSAPASA